MHTTEWLQSGWLVASVFLLVLVDDCGSQNVRQAARLLLDLAALTLSFLLRDQENLWRRSEPDGFHSVPIMSSRFPGKYFCTSKK
jgi:hypothetical protein